MTAHRWTESELARAEVEVGLRPSPDPRDETQRLHDQRLRPAPFATECAPVGGGVPWYARVGILVFVVGVVGLCLIGAAEGHDGHHDWPHGREPLQLIGAILAGPLVVVFSLAVLYGIYRGLRWVLVGR